MNSDTVFNLFLRVLSKNIEIPDFGREALYNVWKQTVTEKPYKEQFNKFWSHYDAYFVHVLDFTDFEHDFRNAWNKVCVRNKESNTKPVKNSDIINIII